jgi:hypothetical protein
MVAAVRRAAVAVCLIGLGGCVVQPAPSVTTPQYWRLRVYAAEPGQSDTVMLQGIIAWAVEDSLRIYHEQEMRHVTLPVSSIARLAIYRGQHATAGTAAAGAATGAGIGALLGALSSAASAAVFGAIWDESVNVTEAVTYGAVEGAVEGAAVGLVAGATLGEGVWQEIPYHDLREEMCHCRLPVGGDSPER